VEEEEETLRKTTEEEDIFSGLHSPLLFVTVWTLRRNQKCKNA